MRLISIFQRGTVQAKWYRWKEGTSPTEYIINPRRSVCARDFEQIHSDYLENKDDSSAVIDCLHRMHGYLLNTTDVPTAMTALGLLEKHERFGRIADVAERGREAIRPMALHYLIKHGKWELAADAILNSNPNCLIDGFIRAFESHSETFISTGNLSALKLIAKMSKDPLFREIASLQIENLERKAKEQPKPADH